MFFFILGIVQSGRIISVFKLYPSVPYDLKFGNKVNVVPRSTVTGGLRGGIRHMNFVASFPVKVDYTEDYLAAVSNAGNFGNIFT